MVCPIVRSGSNPPVCVIAVQRPDRAALSGSVPKTSIWPLSGRVRPRAMSMVVDFPAPFGPRNATTSPRSTVNDTSCTALMAYPLEPRNVLETFLTVRGLVFLIMIFLLVSYGVPA